MGMMQKLHRFGALSAADKWLWLRAAFWLAVARIQLLATPFERLVQRLSTDNVRDAAPPDAAVLSRVRYAVAAAAGNVPWRSDCFPQAIAGRALLQGYGYPSIIHLGVKKGSDDGLAGHAWLTCGDRVVTGGGDLQHYTEVHRFTT
jgi:hypothetical protein